MNEDLFAGLPGEDLDHWIAGVDEAGRGPLAGPVVVGRRIHADQQRQRRGQHHRHHRQGYGQRQAFKHQLVHRGTVDIAVAQVAAQHACDPGAVALRRWLVQAQFVGERLHGFGRSVRAHEDLRRVAGQDLKHPEDDDGGRQQGGDQREQALEQK